MPDLDPWGQRWSDPSKNANQTQGSSGSIFGDIGDVVSGITSHLPGPVGDFLSSAIHGNQVKLPWSGIPPNVLGPMGTGIPTVVPYGPQGPTKITKAKPKKPPKKPPKKAAPIVVQPPDYGTVDTGSTGGIDTRGTTGTTSDLPDQPVADPKFTAWLQGQLGSIMGAKSNSPEVTKLASHLAAMAVQAQVAPILTQQQNLQAQGRSQALNMLAAARAAGNLQSSFGNQLGALYERGAGETQQIAQGYTGQLRDQALADQSQLAQQVAAAGGTFSPPTGLIDNAANALYAAQGSAPATAMGAGTPQFPGQAAVSMQIGQALPHIVRGAGTQAAALAMGAANQQSNALLADIVNAKAQLPRLTQSYIQSLSSADAKSQSNKLAGLSLAVNTYFKGNEAAQRAWQNLVKANQNETRLGQYGRALDQGDTKIDQTGQIANAKLKISGYTAQTGRINAVNRQIDNDIKNTISQQKNKIAARKIWLGLGKTADERAHKISTRIQSLVMGDWKYMTQNGVPTQVMINAPVTPMEAFGKLRDEFPSLFGTKQGQLLLIDQLRRAYGPVRLVMDAEGNKIVVGWSENGTTQAFPIGDTGPIMGPSLGQG